MLVFLFTDIERSTQLWETHGRAMGEALSRHDAIVRESIETFGGQVVKHTGDGMFAVFKGGSPLHSALAIQRRLSNTEWPGIGTLPVRIALHTGEAEYRAGDYFGSSVNRTARLLTAAWGGQVLLSEEVAQLLDPPEDAVLQDHGVHMLKDLGYPQRIYGLVPAEQADRPFPPLRSLSSRSHNLPPQPTPFVGRRQEIVDLLSRLRQPACRLLTIVGPGGMGKTRLALQVAAEEIETYAHGVYQVPLAPLTSMNYIWTTLADALRYPLAGSDEPREQILNYLREKDILLVLDNFEHLISEAGIVSDLLEHCAKLNVLATSRERLNLHEEWTYELHGLPVPERLPASGIEQYGAIQLFMQNAYRVYPDFELAEEEKQDVARICQLVEGIPLGIELASAWVRILSPADIVREIEASRDFLATTSTNVPARHQSLRAVFENSWNLLTARERVVLRQLSIFRGGFQRDAAQEVANASLPLLLSLHDKSLLRRTSSGQYEMLETLRQYAAEKLQEAPEEKETVIKKHYRYFSSLLHRHRMDLKIGGQREAMAALEADHENIRAAWRQAVSHKDYQAIRNALDGLFHLYEVRGWLQEAAHLFEKAVSTLQDAATREEQVVLSMLCLRHGWFSFRLGMYEIAEADMLDSLKQFRRLEEPEEAAFALYNLGILSYQLGHYNRARVYLEESLQLRRALNDRFGTARSLSILGIVARDLGENQTARELLTESLALHRAVGDGRGISRCLNLLALLHRDTGEEQAARPLLEESLAISREIEDRRGIAYALSILGAIVYEMGDYVTAREMIQESLEIREEVGEQRGIAFSLHDLGNVARALEQYQAARDYLQRALRVAIDIQAVPLALYVITGIAELRASQGKYQEALALALLVLNHPSTFEMANDRAQAIRRQVCDELDPEEISAITDSVHASDFEQVVDRLLQPAYQPA